VPARRCERAHQAEPAHQGQPAPQGQPTPWGEPAGGDAPGRRRGEGGAAVVDFVLVLVPLLIPTLGVLQVAFTVFVKTTATDGVSAGARVGAEFGHGPGDGAGYAAALLGHSLGSAAGQSVTGGLDGGGTVVVVRARVPLTFLGLVPLGPASLTVTGHAVREQL